MRAITLCLPAVALLLAAAPPATAEGMALLRTKPRPSQVMSGTGVAFALHFNRPLDHQRSSFMLQGPDGAARTVPVRLGAQPSVLYASVGRLPPGAYTQTWSARSSSGKVLGGTLPFTVRPDGGNG